LFESGPANGVVHSVFRRALNLRLNGGLAVLLDAGCGNAPAGVRVAGLPCTGWLEMARAGEPIGIRGGVLRGARFTLPLLEAPVWRMQACRSGRPLGQAAIGRLQAGIERYCRAHRVTSCLALHDGLRGGLRPVLSPMLPLARLVDAVAGLVGTGGGLTPDGDDFLVGYLAIFHAGSSAASVRHRQRVAEAVREHLPRTNDISAHYLQHACDGYFNEPLARLRHSLFETSAFERQALDDVLSTGAASGADSVFGMVSALQDLAVPEPEARNPEPGARSPEPGARSPEPGARIPEPGTRNPEPGTRNPEPGTRNPEPGTRNPEPGAWSPEPGAWSPEPGARNSEPGTRNPEPGTHITPLQHPLTATENH
jgi:hypothetical protein